MYPKVKYTIIHKIDSETNSNQPLNNPPLFGKAKSAEGEKPTTVSNPPNDIMKDNKKKKKISNIFSKDDEDFEEDDYATLKKEGGTMTYITNFLFLALLATCIGSYIAYKKGCSDYGNRTFLYDSSNSEVSY